MIWLILLVLIVVVVVFVMHFRRQARAREAASAERMKAFLDQARAGNGIAAANPGATAAPTAAAREVKPHTAPNVPGLRLRAPLLDAGQLAAYRALQSALPDHQVWAQVSLAAFVAPVAETTGFAREAALRRLADTTVDFLICNETSTPLVAVQCGARSGKAAEAMAYAQACVAGAGVRWLELSPQALPVPQALRQQVLGT